MSLNEQPSSLHEEITLLDQSKSILVLNKEFPKLKEFIEKGLKAKKYNYLVSIDNIDTTKKTTTELNKIANNISSFRKEKKISEMKDIDIFDANLVQCENLVKDKRQELLNAIAKAEEEVIKQRINNAKKYLSISYEAVLLREEFRTVNVEDMTKKGYSTERNKLNKAAKDEIKKRVNEKLTLQTKVDNRLLNIENECLKAGVAPMSKEYIEGFIYEDDATYKQKLDALIQMESKRAETEKARFEEEARIKAEKEAKQKVLAEQKALKEELHARYESQIKNADMQTLIRINLELKSYDVAATYELRQFATKREFELSKQKEKVISEGISKVQDDLKERDTYEVKVASDGKIEKTLSIKIKVPGNATDKQVIDAVIKMIKGNKFPIENIEVN